jgi:peptide deformylase
VTIHRIRLLGDPVLRAGCEPITKPQSAAVRVIMDDMRETLRDWQSRFAGGRGIAAPQIGAPVRMVYIDMGQPWPLINPEIIDIGNEDFDVWDDCFSFPNLLVRVSRAYRIRVRYQDLKGEWLELDVEGDRAELLQHEGWIRSAYGKSGTGSTELTAGMGRPSPEAQVMPRKPPTRTTAPA